MKEKVFNNLGFIILAFVITLYFILSYVGIEKLQIDILKITVNGGLLFLGATIANSALMKQGLLSGKNNDKYKETVTTHITQKLKIYPKLNNLQTWLDEDYAKLLQIGRTVYTNSAGFDYEEVFDKKGKKLINFKLTKPKAITFRWFDIVGVFGLLWIFRQFFVWIFHDDWKIYREKKHYIRKAKRYKITRLTVSNLINIDDNNDPNNFTASENTYIAKNTIISTITRFIIGILCPSISFIFFGFNMANFLYNLMVAIMIILTSLSAFYSAYMFIIRTSRNGIIMKINKMEEFDNSIKGV